MEEKQWYVVNTYAGHENRVKENLEKRVETMGIGDSDSDSISERPSGTQRVPDGNSTTSFP